jgi:hypothetical protein
MDTQQTTALLHLEILYTYLSQSGKRISLPAALELIRPNTRQRGASDLGRGEDHSAVTFHIMKSAVLQSNGRRAYH